MVRTVARYHEEKKLNEERAKREEQNKLRRIAASIAREIEYFWSNIEQVKYRLINICASHTVFFIFNNLFIKFKCFMRLDLHFRLLK